MEIFPKTVFPTNTHASAKKMVSKAKNRKTLETRCANARRRYQHVDAFLLKGDGGVLLNHKQEHAALVEHSKTLFAHLQPQPDRAGVQLPLFFTIEEVESQLRLTKVGRAVPRTNGLALGNC